MSTGNDTTKEREPEGKSDGRRDSRRMGPAWAAVVSALAFLISACGSAQRPTSSPVTLGTAESSPALTHRGAVDDVAALHTKACDKGDTGRCVTLGFMFEKGRGVVKDEARAVALYTQACEGRDAGGCSNLGAMFATGRGVSKNEARAVTLYTQACEADSSLPSHPNCNFYPKESTMWSMCNHSNFALSLTVALLVSCSSPDAPYNPSSSGNGGTISSGSVPNAVSDSGQDVPSDTGPTVPSPVTYNDAAFLIGDGAPPGTVFGCDVDLAAESYVVQALGVLQSPNATGRLVDIGLDRQSFLDRGWPDAALGRYNNGSQSERRGVFLSMYYALQMGGVDTVSHPWNEEINSWERGIGAHIDYYLNDQHALRFFLYVYDNPNPPTKKGLVVGRLSTEVPFTKPGCNVPNVIGCAGGDDMIYIRTDYSYALGRRLDEPAIIGANGNYYPNLTYVIAHEVGHFFGFPHVSATDAIMYPQIGTAVTQRWHDASLQQQALFVELAHVLQ